MTSKDIRKIMFKYILEKKNHEIAIAEWDYCDIFSLTKSGFSYEWEIKVSRADFLRDFKKFKHNKYCLPEYTRHYFSFVCPDDLIKISDIPLHHGLYYVSAKGSIQEVRKPKKQHKKPLSDNLVRRIARSLCRKLYTPFSKKV